MSVTEMAGTSAVTLIQEGAPWIVGYDEAAFRAVAGVTPHPAERAAREAAFRRYAAAPTPHSKMEEWRHTDPASLPFARLPRLPSLSECLVSAHEWDTAFDIVIAVTERGWQVIDRVGLVAQGAVSVWDLSKALVEGVTSEEEISLWSPRPDQVDKVVLLADAFWSVGFYVKVAPGVEVPRGMLIRCANAASSNALIGRLVVQMGSRSRMTVFERHDSLHRADVLSVFSKRINVAEAARVSWTTLRMESDRAVHIADEWVSLERDARVEWTICNLGGRLIKGRFTGDARQAGAAVELDGLYFACGEQHMDQKTLQAHSSPNTFSRLLYKGVVKDRAYSVYQGRIIAWPGAVRVDAYQKNNNLVLNDGARADSMPGLQIDADDLKCGHGSTIGNLDNEQLFYLRSRGIDEQTARAVLIHGFFEEILQRLLFEPAREAVAQQITARIAS